MKRLILVLMFLSTFAVADDAIKPLESPEPWPVEIVEVEPLTPLEEAEQRASRSLGIAVVLSAVCFVSVLTNFIQMFKSNSKVYVVREIPESEKITMITAPTRKGKS